MVLCLKARESRSLPGLQSAICFSYMIFTNSNLTACLTLGVGQRSFLFNPSWIKQGAALSVFASQLLVRDASIVRRTIGAGWSSPVARQAHNLKVAGSNPAPATKLSCIKRIANKDRPQGRFLRFRAVLFGCDCERPNTSNQVRG